MAGGGLGEKWEGGLLAQVGRIAEGGKLTQGDPKSSSACHRGHHVYNTCKSVFDPLNHFIPFSLLQLSPMVLRVCGAHKSP